MVGEESSDVGDALARLVDEWLRLNWMVLTKSNGWDFDVLARTLLQAQPDIVKLGEADGMKTVLEWAMLLNSRAQARGYYVPREEPQYDPDEYFDFKTDKLLSAELGRDIAMREKLRYAVDRATFYHPNDGVFHEVPDEWILFPVKKILGERVDDFSSHQVGNIVHSAKVHGLCEYEKDFNRDIKLLPVLNGVLNLETRELLAHNPDKLKFTTQLPITYDPSADCPAFKKFLSDILYEDEIPVIQELFGFVLWRDHFIRKAFMLVGGGANGKSILISVLERFLGSANYCSVSLTELAESVFAQSMLRDKMANIYGDLTDKAVRDTGIFKMVTGGDSIKCEEKYKPGTTFVPYAKLVFATNAPPEAKDDTDAYYERWQIVSFPYTFLNLPPELLAEGQKLARPADDLKRELTAETELSGILNWALDGLARLRVNGRFTNSKTVEELRKRIIWLTNSLRAFVDERCRVQPNSGWVIKKSDFYQHYLRFCEEYELNAKALANVTKELPQINSCIEHARHRFDGGSPEYAYKNIKLVETVPGTQTDTPQTSLPVEQPTPEKVEPVTKEEKTVAQRRLDQLTEKYDEAHIEWILKRMVAKLVEGETVSAHELRSDARDLGEHAETVSGIIDLHYIELEDIAKLIHRRRKTETKE